MIKVKGPKGELNWNYPDGIKVSVNGGNISVERSVTQRLKGHFMVLQEALSPIWL